MEDLTALSLARIDELTVDAGFDVTMQTSKFIQMNASNEAQYEVTYYSNVFNKVLSNHAFVDFDAQDDIRLRMTDLEEGELNLRSDTPEDSAPDGIAQ